MKITTERWSSYSMCRKEGRASSEGVRGGQLHRQEPPAAAKRTGRSSPVAKGLQAHAKVRGCGIVWWPDM